MIRVLVAEDHLLVRQGIVKLLEGESDLQVVGAADNGREAIQLIEALQPDVVVLDISMAQLGGLETLAELSGRQPRPRMVILSMHADPGLVRQALRAGVLGYVAKQSVADELLAAVRAANNGSLYLSSGISGVLAGDFFAERLQTLLDRLSPQEAGVQGVMMRGKADLGDKTKVDALLPAVQTLAAAAAARVALPEALRRSELVAGQSLLDTIPLPARKARASYLGQRGAGHQDPGATSSHLLLKAAADTWSSL